MPVRVGTNRLMHYSLREVVPKGMVPKEGGGREQEDFAPRGKLAISGDTVGCHIRGVLLSSSE